MKVSKRYRTGLDEASVVKTYALTESDVSAYYRDSYLPTVISWGLLALSSIICCCVSIVSGIGVLIAGLSGLVVSLAFVSWACVKWVRGMRATSKQDGLYEEHMLDLNHIGFSIGTGDARSNRIPWLAVPRILCLRSCYALQIAQGTPLVLPKRIFSEEERFWLERQVLPVVKKRKKILAQNAGKK